MNESAIFEHSLFDRIAACIPVEQRTSFYRYVAHLRSLNPKDELLLLAMGMGFFTVVTQQAPAAIAAEREKLIAELTQLCRKHEATAAAATADTRAMFTAHQKLLEQNIGAWQSREQKTLRALEEVAGTFEKLVSAQTARLQSSVAEIDTATKVHRVNGQKAEMLLQSFGWNQLFWPCFASATVGALIAMVLTLWVKH